LRSDGIRRTHALAMLARRAGKTLSALPRRLDHAMGRCFEDGESTGEINSL